MPTDHGQIACVDCHNGVQSPDKEIAHEGLIASPSSEPEKYCGDCRFQKTFIQNPISHKSVPNRGELPQFLVEDCLPAIVNKETWNVAQEIRKRHTYC